MSERIIYMIIIINNSNKNGVFSYNNFIMQL